MIAADRFPDPPDGVHSERRIERMTFSGGCFWFTEAVYRQLDGVLDVTSGYAGGTEQTANYADLSSDGSVVTRWTERRYPVDFKSEK